jgi:hypothetical protein
MQIKLEDGIRLMKQLLEQLGALDEAKQSLRDASWDLSGEEGTIIGDEVMLAANLCRLASDILVPQIKKLERAKKEAEARSTTPELKLEPKPVQEPKNPYEVSPRILRCPTTMEG